MVSHGMLCALTRGVGAQDLVPEGSSSSRSILLENGREDRSLSEDRGWRRLTVNARNRPPLEHQFLLRTGLEV